ncbi:hypothetical protein NUU61_007697 [Penicillium alfredii]|uniref:Uncharacterized protein n=1 Tax=Penicillium alfredii TaxID=1506179 RepID=A0A9W9ER82_9EURO|nr:uncharacterized protein NUU61_007697 [Penicillium alfredii]KAJ5086390.1 hypothetical protein NUU61_007697 [Penicillium alfredii]
MAIDTDAASRPEAKEETKPNGQEGDDFIPLGGDSDASDDDDDNSDNNDAEAPDDDSASFHPYRITLETFRRLLECYPTTVEQVHRRKMMLKLQPKPEKGSKRSAEKRAGSASTNARGAALIRKTDFNPSEQRHIRTETDRFLLLDQWRYDGMPQALAQRKESEKKESWSLNKEDLITAMDWKTKHGLPRPTLMGMIKTNQNKAILKSTAAAFATLPTADPMLDPNAAFPKPSLDALTTPLRGIGVATASLILSIATANGDPAHQIPFYSDDLYLWLCLKDFPETESVPENGPEQPLISSGGTTEDAAAKPKKKLSKFKRPNGELNVKYNLHEYRQLWNASWELRQRLNRAVEAEAEAEGGSDSKDADESKGSSHLSDRLVSHLDIEKVAYVLRNIAVSGFYPDQDPEAILQAKAADEAEVVAAAKNDQPGEKTEKKRKRKDKDEGKKSGSRNAKRKKA